MVTQNFEDEDVTATLEWLRERLAENIRLLSSWDKYKKEVLSGTLDWSPMHNSEAFWLENGAHLEDKDFQILRVLLKLLETSRDGRTLAVAANDLSQFITYVPHGRQIVQGAFSRSCCVFEFVFACGRGRAGGLVAVVWWVCQQCCGGCVVKWVVGWL